MATAKNSTIAFDTNILVYAFDKFEPRKRKIAKALFADVISGKKEGIVTNQVLAEFAAVLTRGVVNPLPPEQIRSIVSTILSSENFTVHNYDGETVLHSIGSKRFWDALLARTLVENGVKQIYTENVKHFNDSGLAVINPLR